MRRARSPGGVLDSNLADEHSGPEPPPVPPPEGRPGLELKGVLELVGSVAAPVTVVTALLFYFGWAYTGAFYGYFAIDRTMLDLSVRDYLLRSINPMLWPLIFCLALAGVWVWGHGRLVRSITSERRRLLVLRLSLVVGGVGVACFLTGLLGAGIGNQYTSLAVSWSRRSAWPRARPWSGTPATSIGGPRTDGLVRPAASGVHAWRDRSGLAFSPCWSRSTCCGRSRTSPTPSAAGTAISLPPGTSGRSRRSSSTAPSGCSSTPSGESRRLRWATRTARTGSAMRISGC
jgi:hypothetical protein